LKFLNCLEQSGNYSALEILDPTRRRQPLEPTDQPTLPKPENKPTLSTYFVHEYIKTSDVAKILHEKTILIYSWTDLKDILEINSETWIRITSDSSIQFNCFISVLHIIDRSLQEWSRSKGIKGATVGVLYDQLKNNGYKEVGGKLRKHSVMSEGF
jgi:hypothetical protein